jgi:hypothetical protein
MTASYVDHDAQTVHRPQLTFVPQVGPVPRPADSSPTWKTGWVVSGLAAILALSSLGLVGAVALDALSQSDFAPEVVSTSAPVAPPKLLPCLRQSSPCTQPRPARPPSRIPRESW